MKQFFASFFGTIAGLLVVSLVMLMVVVGIISSIISAGGADQPLVVKTNSILHVKFDHEIVERGRKSAFESLPLGGKGKIGLDQVLECFEKAKADSNIKGVYLQVMDIAAAPASLEEIRNAIMDFKESGKFIIAYSEGYSQKAYYLASLADKVLMHPQGALEWKGLSAQVMFYKGALEKLQIDAQIFRHGKFKSAIEPFDLEKMSPANREQTMMYITSIWNYWLDGISKQRNISIDEMNHMADELLVQNAEEAVKYKLVDELKYQDEVTDLLKAKLAVDDEKKINYVDLKDYVRTPGSVAGSISKNKIAVIYAVGSIESGEGDDETIGSDRIAKAIRKARTDSSVKAIVLRVNSPGGSALASDVMWREVLLAKKVKPVVVSMGDYAASGGYYISCAADAIVAQPTTITGSIGVFGVLPNAKEFFNNKLGITVDTVNSNAHSDMGSLFRPITEKEGMVIQRSVEEVYKTFVDRVAEGRKMIPDTVDHIGQGRVWSGIDAKKRGLVDELGGLETAISIAAKKAKLEHYQVKQLPEPTDPFKQMLKELGGGIETDILQSELGVHYEHFKHMKNIMNIKGVQARMPYDVFVF